MALKGPCVAKDETPLRRANDVVFKMASAVGVRSEHKVNIDRSKETDRFYCEFTNIRIIMREKKGRMPFPILCILQRVLSDYSSDIKTKKSIEFPEI